MQKTVLSIGKFDPRGVSGIQKEFQTVEALGGHVYAVATFCLAPANPSEIFLMPPELVAVQLNGLIDASVGCIKIGNLVGAEMMNVVADFVEGPAKHLPLLLEPVMTSSRAQKFLMDQESMQAYERRLFFHANLLCPNVTEARRLTGLPISNLDEMQHATEMLLTLGNEAVLLTGGSLPGDKVYDIYADLDGMHIYESSRMVKKTPEGTGSALTAAISYHMAKGHRTRDAVERGRIYVQDLIREYADANPEMMAG